MERFHYRPYMYELKSPSAEKEKQRAKSEQRAIPVSEAVIKCPPLGKKMLLLVPRRTFERKRLRNKSEGGSTRMNPS